MVLHGGHIYLAWTGTDRRLNVGVFAPDKEDLISKRVFQETSTCSPSLVSHNNQLFMTWSSNTNTINLAKVPVVGSSLFDIRTFSDISSSAIALLSHKNLLHMAWRGSEPNYSLHLATCDPDLGSFKKSVAVMDSLAGSPSIASYHDQLFVAWTDNSFKLNVATIMEDESVANKVIFDDTSHEAPCLITENDQLSIAWIGIDTQHQLNIARVNGNQLVDKKMYKAPYTEDVFIYVPFRGMRPTLHHFGPHNIHARRIGSYGIQYQGGYFVYAVNYQIPDEPTNLSLHQQSKAHYDELVYHNHAIYLFHP